MYLKNTDAGSFMLFPLSFVPKESFKVAPRKFGAPRANGRKHAACDLYAPPGSGVYAVAAGKIIAFKPFYEEVFQITIDHDDYIVRYGEVAGKTPKGIRVGAKVEQGEFIGWVGYMARLKLSMLHFEMYSGEATGPLSTNSGQYKRRSDLMDPTQHLESAAKALILEGAQAQDLKEL
jgi:murein DD-endopeptidase MepM/ murein hydrolase activator NlpD